MLLLFIAAAGAGVLLGLALLRVLAVFAASVALGVTAVVWMILGQWPLLGAIVYAFMLLATLQCSYLVGLIFSSPARKFRMKRPIHADR
jgi:energy-converting hydrogenase Eha subunit A